jgi:hypothetical protein
MVATSPLRHLRLYGLSAFDSTCISQIIANCISHSIKSEHCQHDEEAGKDSQVGVEAPVRSAGGHIGQMPQANPTLMTWLKNELKSAIEGHFILANQPDIE